MIGAIVLAAGKSERMGWPKALLPCRGATFLGTILSTLEDAGVREVRVVLGRDAERVRLACPLPSALVAVNPEPERGMLSSVRCGLAALPPGLDGLLLWPVDHPLVVAGTVRALIAALESSGAPLAIPAHGGKRGHPALFAARLLPELAAAPEREGARAVVRAHAADLAEVEVDDAGVLADIDTPAEYEAAFSRRLMGEWEPEAER